MLLLLKFPRVICWCAILPGARYERVWTGMNGEKAKAALGLWVFDGLPWTPRQHLLMDTWYLRQKASKKSKYLNLQLDLRKAQELRRVGTSDIVIGKDIEMEKSSGSARSYAVVPEPARHLRNQNHESSKHEIQCSPVLSSVLPASRNGQSWAQPGRGSA